MAVGEELDSIDVRLVTSERLDRFASTDVPQLGKGVASTGNKCILVCRVEADAHDIAEMVCELGDALASLNVPLDTGHVARRG